MTQQLLIRFARKPESLKEVRAVAHCDAYHHQQVRVAETVTLTAAEYDAFTRNFNKDCGWLAGKGGSCNGMIQAIAVEAEGRETLYVNPEGYSYARYVGIHLAAA